VVGTAVAQRAIRRLGVRTEALLGMATAAFGLFLLSGLPTSGGYSTNLLPGLVLASIGMGLTFVPVTLIATSNVAPADAGLASGIFNTAQHIGGSRGLALLSTIAASRTANFLSSHAAASAKAAALVDGYKLALATSAGLVVTALVVIALLIRRRDVAQIEVAEASSSRAGSKLPSPTGARAN
jgi:hypothetical protein